MCLVHAFNKHFKCLLCTTLLLDQIYCIVINFSSFFIIQMKKLVRGKNKMLSIHWEVTFSCTANSKILLQQEHSFGVLIPKSQHIFFNSLKTKTSWNFPVLKMFSFSYGWVVKVRSEQMAVKTPVTTHQGWELTHKNMQLTAQYRHLPCKCQWPSGLETAKSIWRNSIFALSSMDVKLCLHLVESLTGKIMSPEPFQTTLFHFPTLGNSWNLNMTHTTRHIA